MATKLDMNVRSIIENYGGVVVKRGVTGGSWDNREGLVGGYITCGKYERNNLAMWIKEQPNAELVECVFGPYYRLNGHCIATGAGYGGCKHRRAKQKHFAVIKIGDGLEADED